MPFCIFHIIKVLDGGITDSHRYHDYYRPNPPFHSRCSGTAALTNLLIDVIGKAGDSPIGVSIENIKPVFRQQTIVLTERTAD